MQFPECTMLPPASVPKLMLTPWHHPRLSSPPSLGGPLPRASQLDGAKEGMCLPLGTKAIRAPLLEHSLPGVPQKLPVDSNYICFVLPSPGLSSVPATQQVHSGPEVIEGDRSSNPALSIEN